MRKLSAIMTGLSALALAPNAATAQDAGLPAFPTTSGSLESSVLEGSATNRGYDSNAFGFKKHVDDPSQNDLPRHLLIDQSSVTACAQAYDAGQTQRVAGRKMAFAGLVTCFRSHSGRRFTAVDLLRLIEVRRNGSFLITGESGAGGVYDARDRLWMVQDKGNKTSDVGADATQAEALQAFRRNGIITYGVEAVAAQTRRRPKP